MRRLRHALGRVLQLEGFDPGRFDAIPAGLWSEDGSLRLYAPQDPAHVSHSALNLQHTTEHIDVPARRMSSLLAERANFVFVRRAALAEPA